MLFIYDFVWNLIAELLSAMTKNRVFCVFKSHPAMGFLKNNNWLRYLDVIFDEKDGPRWFEFFEKCDTHTNKHTDRRKIVQNSILGTKNVVFFVYLIKNGNFLIFLTHIHACKIF